MRLELNLAATLGGFRLEAQLDTQLNGVTALFGPSGAGKSSILRAIAGFSPDMGRVAVDGAVWQAPGTRPIAPHRRPVGLVFQDGRLFDHRSVAGNLYFAARRGDPNGPLITFDDAVAALDLAPLLARRPATLSGGERQRVAVARALLTRPRLLLLDEPLTGLDRARKAQILPMIASAPRRFGVRVIYVSHLVEEIVKIADDLIAVADGRVVGAGPVAEMLERLEPEVTGRFEAGSILVGRVAGDDAEFDLTRVSVGDAVLVSPGRAGRPAGAEARLRIRARDVSIALAAPSGLSIRNRLPARVVEVRLEQGPYAEIALEVFGQRLIARLTRASVAELNLRPGLDVVALVKAAAFDRRLEPPS